MKYQVDHDLHIHSYLSECSQHPLQTPENILKYAEDNGFNTICLTDHFWDEKVSGANDWYKPQNFSHISKSKPLPQSKNVRFLFGCETEVTKNNVLGLSKEMVNEFDYIVIPTTHFHMTGFTISEEDSKSIKAIAKNWVERFEHVLNMDLPFKKVGIAHLTCSCIGPSCKELPQTLAAIPDSEMKRLFAKASKLGVGIELNADDMRFDKNIQDDILRPYKIAKECGCKFYVGSDSHSPNAFVGVKDIFEKAVRLLDLDETDKIDFLK